MYSDAGARLKEAAAENCDFEAKVEQQENMKAEDFIRDMTKALKMAPAKDLTNKFSEWMEIKRSYDTHLKGSPLELTQTVQEMMSSDGAQTATRKYVHLSVVNCMMRPPRSGETKKSMAAAVIRKVSPSTKAQIYLAQLKAGLFESIGATAATAAATPEKKSGDERASASAPLQ